MVEIPPNSSPPPGKNVKERGGCGLVRTGGAESQARSAHHSTIKYIVEKVADGYGLIVVAESHVLYDAVSKAAEYQL